MLRRVIRDPLTAFALIGMLIFAVYYYLQSQRTAPVRLSVETRQNLIEEFERLTGRGATPNDVTRLEHEYISDELLFREALAQGLHLRSSAIRGELITQMRMEVTGLLPEPDDETLVNYYADHLERYYTEPAITFEQIFFNSEPNDAPALLAALRRGDALAGDTFDQGAAFPGYGESMIRGIFGQPFAATLWSTPGGEWQGPLRSTRGWHFVRVEGRTTPALLPFDQARTQVENDYLVTLIQTAVDARVDALAAKYGVEVEP